MSYHFCFLYNGPWDIRWNCFISSPFCLLMRCCGLLCDSQKHEKVNSGRAWLGAGVVGILGIGAGPVPSAALSYYFVSSCIIKLGPNHAHAPDRNNVINFVYSLIWTFHRTIESLNHLDWNRPWGASSLLRAGSKGPLKVWIRSSKVWLLYWPWIFANGLQTKPPNPGFSCNIYLLTTWRV